MELLKHVLLPDVHTAMFVEELVSREMFHQAHAAAQMPSLEELGLEYECFYGVRDTATEIQGPAGASLDDNSALFFPRLKVLRVHELHHDSSVQYCKHMSEYHLLRRQLANLQKKGGTRFSQLDISVERSDFHAMIPQNLHCFACDTAHLAQALRNARSQASRPFSIFNNLF